MENTNTKWLQVSDTAIVKQIGSYIRHERLQQNETQAQLAEKTGLSRWTLSQIENGEPVTLLSLIQILRALGRLDAFKTFEISDEISPLEYAKLKKKQKKRVRNKAVKKPNKDDLEW